MTRKVHGAGTVNGGRGNKQEGSGEFTNNQRRKRKVTKGRRTHHEVRVIVALRREHVLVLRQAQRPQPPTHRLVAALQHAEGYAAAALAGEETEALLRRRE